MKLTLLSKKEKERGTEGFDNSEQGKLRSISYQRKKAQDAVKKVAEGDDVVASQRGR